MLVDVLNFGEWKAVVPTNASTKVDFLFHTDNKVRKREAVLNTENKAGECIELWGMEGCGPD